VYEGLSLPPSDLRADFFSFLSLLDRFLLCLCLPPSEDFIDESSDVDESDTDEESELEPDGSEGSTPLGSILNFSFFSRSPLRGVSTI